LLQIHPPSLLDLDLYKISASRSSDYWEYGNSIEWKIRIKWMEISKN